MPHWFAEDDPIERAHQVLDEELAAFDAGVPRPIDESPQASLAKRIEYALRTWHRRQEQAGRTPAGEDTRAEADLGALAIDIRVLAARLRESPLVTAEDVALIERIGVALDPETANRIFVVAYEYGSESTAGGSGFEWYFDREARDAAYASLARGFRERAPEEPAAFTTFTTAVTDPMNRTLTKAEIERAWDSFAPELRVGRDWEEKVFDLR